MSLNISPVTVGGIALQTPIIICAGVCKSVTRTNEWLSVAPVVSGSYTKEPRLGNQGEPRSFPDSLEKLSALGYGLNAFGMQNDGFSATAAQLQRVPSAPHPLIISIAGFSVTDYIVGVATFSLLPIVAAIELNVSCPNTDANRLLGFSAAELQTLLSRLSENAITTPLWLKLPPYSDPALLTEVVELVNKYPNIVKAVVTTNTFPNSYGGQDTIGANQGYAGLSGPAMKPIALGQVRQIKSLLSSKIDVIGVGGIMNLDDVEDFLAAGSNAVEITSLAYWSPGPQEFWNTLHASTKHS